MELLLLGTGSADGWPNPWCTCASCAWARGSGTVRSTTSVLLDRRLLIDCGPDAPRQADRAGVGLHDVSVVLLTHGHHDHLAPGALLARTWSHAGTPLRVLGPRSALDACRDWIGPHDPVTLVEVAAGDTVEVDGYAVRVLAAAHDVGRDALTRDAVLYDVTAPDGARLLHACDTGPLPQGTVEAVRGSAYDVVLLEETFGTTYDHGTGHLDLATFPLQLARLREAGAVVEGTDVLAVHLSHHNPPGPELDAILAAWGARAPRDLDRLDTAPSPAARRDREPAADAPSVSPRTTARRRLVLGGARSGKSHEAERRLLAEPSVTYVATGGARADDPEWTARVAAHRARRPAGWTTLETLDVADLLRTAAPGDPVLVDCLALWLAGHLERTRTWESDPGTPAYAESLALAHRAIDDLVAAVARTSAHVVLVSNEVGSGVVPEHASGRLYRDLLGTLNARVAAVCDDVDLVVAGRAITLTTTQERLP
jgi:adenosylcobinamide kinase/adenosylcobinamide-phosphate guanylyltransferase